MSATRRLLVAIPTFRRPDRLAATLPPVIEQARAVSADPALGVSASVTVVDNDPAGSARGAVEALGGEVGYVVQPVAGIAAARNRALDAAADADAVVFIDDDEQPREDWLAALVRTWIDTGAAAVMGRVVSEFEVEPEPWVAAGDFFRRRSMATGTEIEVAATGNLLLDAGQLRRLGVRFDERLGTGGGEDSLLSLQLRRAGGRMVWCEESVATDGVPADRLTRTWLRSRFFHHGNTAVVVRLLDARSPAERASVRARAAVGGLARLAGGCLRGLAGTLTGSLALRARSMATRRRGLGMLAASLGLVRREYDRPA